MTRLYIGGTPIKVRIGADGLPYELVWRETVHPVAAVTRRWRIHRGWWRDPVWRDYFKLETRTGALAEVYHDLNTNKWYLQRWYE